MRLPVFLVAVSAVLPAAAQQLYTEPTFAQVERLIGAVQEAGGDSGAYDAAAARSAGSLYGKPTFAQVERLISEVRTNGAAVTAALSPSNVSVRVAETTGIHIGEPSVKTQYVKGVWTTATAVTADKTVEIGYNAHATESGADNQSIAIGRDSLANGKAVVAVGPNAFAEGAQAVAVGWRANAVGDHSVSIGSAKQSGQNYYKDGVVNPASDLQLAEGGYSVAVGYNDKAKGESSIAIGNEAKATTNNATAVGKNAQATAEGAVQFGTGVNAEAHTLKFEDVTIVRNGSVVGAAPDPAEADLTPVVGKDYDYRLSVAPGSMTTLLPSVPLNGGESLGLACSGMRNYTVYLPNEPMVREGLPIGRETQLPDGVRGIIAGPAWISRLPCRLSAEQPYSKLVVLGADMLDDGSDWTPVITNCCIVYRMDGRFVSVAPSVRGVNLHCATEFTLSYPVSKEPGSATNTVTLLAVQPGQPHVIGTLYGSAPAVDYPVSGDVGVNDDGYLPVVLTYTTVNGTTEYRTMLDTANP